MPPVTLPLAPSARLVRRARLLAVIGLAAALVAAGTALALAADATTSVSIGWGDMLAQAGSLVGSALLGGLLWLLRKLPASILSWLQTMQVEQLLARAIAYGVNATTGAAAGKTLSVSVGSSVLASALQYALDRIPSVVLSWVGGTDALAAMIWARLDLDESATLDDFEALVAKMTTPAAA